jgi:serine/threonine-protein kinase SRPK3
MHGKLTDQPVNALQTWTQLQELTFETSTERRLWLKKQKRKEKKKKQKQRKKEQLKAAGVQPVNKRKRNRKRKPKQLKTPPTMLEPQPQEEEEWSEGEVEGEVVDKSELLAGAVHKTFVQHLPPVDEQISVKIADLGNACWLNRHFSTEIQTRQYRSPEVMIGVSYNASADIWSFACMIFELATGDFLFEPKGDDTLSKEEDHLAQMIELLGKFSRNFALSGLDSKKFFTKKGELRRVKSFRYWPVKSVLSEKYGFLPEEATAFAAFLGPMLEADPQLRASAAKCLEHPWLKMPSNYDTKLTPEAYSELIADLELRQAHLVADITSDEKRLYNAEAVSSVDSVRRYSETDADVEDNNSTLTDDVSESGEEPEEILEATEYHDNMRRQRERLLKNLP